MYTILILAFVGLIVGVFNVAKDIRWLDFWESLIIIPFGSIMGALFGALLGFLIAITIPTSLKMEKEIYTLESLNDSRSINGGFFLGSGIINEKPIYIFYYKTNGGFKLKQISAKNVIIKYNEQLQPCYIVFKRVNTKKPINLFSIYLRDRITKQIIIVPRGTIKNNYKLDSN